MVDGYVQVPADGVGKKIQTDEIQLADGSLVGRQRMADGQKVELTGEFANLILLELRVMSFLLARVQGALLADVHPIDLTDLRQELGSVDLHSSY